MLRFLFKFLAVVLGTAGVAILALAIAGPFLISTAPAPGLAANTEAATADSRFARIPFAGTQGLEVHYLESGTGAPADAMPFLLLHGFTFNVFTWTPVMETFAARSRTIAYDQLPYGLSAKPLPGDGPDPYSKAAAIEQLFATMDALGLERAVLVGNSSGGTLALEAALARPERVAGLVLIAPWVKATRPTLPAWLADLPQMRRLSLLIARTLGGGESLLELSYADPEGIVAARRALYAIHARIAGWDLAWGALLAGSLSTPVTVDTRLDQVRVPTLVVSGDQDRLVPVDDSREVAGRLPDGQFALIEGCGHVPQEECPAEFADALNAWLDDRRL